MAHDPSRYTNASSIHQQAETTTPLSVPTPSTLSPTRPLESGSVGVSTEVGVKNFPPRVEKRIQKMAWVSVYVCLFLRVNSFLCKCGFCYVVECRYQVYLHCMCVSHSEGRKMDINIVLPSFTSFVY